MRAKPPDPQRIGENSGTVFLWLRRTMLFCGILSSLTWMGTDIIASLSYEGYRWPIDAISGLSAVDSPVQLISHTGTLLYELLRIIFAAGLWLSAGGQRSIRITAAALLAFSLTDLVAFNFPWYPDDPLTTPANLAHGVFAGFLPMIWFFLSMGTGAHAGGKGFRTFSYATILAMLILGMLPLLGSFEIGLEQPPEFFGAGERINAYGYMLWMLLLAIVLLRKGSNDMLDPAPAEDDNPREKANRTLLGK